MRGKIEAAAGATAILGAFFLSTFAFSRKSRQAIWERAGGVSELSGQRTNRMECAHLNHFKDKNLTWYDNPENGLLVTLFEHAAHHRMFMLNPRAIGLTYKANKSAYYSILERIYKLENFEDEEDIEKKIQEGMRMWREYYKRRKIEQISFLGES